MRIEPPPSPHGTDHARRHGGRPPEDPPGVWSVFQGSDTGRETRLGDPHDAHLGCVALPMICRPAASYRSTFTRSASARGRATTCTTPWWRTRERLEVLDRKERPAGARREDGPSAPARSRRSGHGIQRRVSRVHPRSAASRASRDHLSFRMTPPVVEVIDQERQGHGVSGHGVLLRVMPPAPPETQASPFSARRPDPTRFVTGRHSSRRCPGPYPRRPSELPEPHVRGGRIRTS